MFTYFSNVKKTEADARNSRRQSYTDSPPGPILFLGRSVETRRGGQPTLTSNQVIGEKGGSRPFFYAPPSNNHYIERSIQYMKPPLIKPIPFPSELPEPAEKYRFSVETRTRVQKKI